MTLGNGRSGLSVIRRPVVSALVRIYGRTPQDRKWTWTELAAGIARKRETSDCRKKIPIANLGEKRGCYVF